MLDIWQSFQTNQTSYFIFYVGRLEEKQQGKNIQYCHFPQGFQRQDFATAINIRYHGCCSRFFSFICVYFSLFFFWSNTVCRDLIARIRAELKKNHFPVSKVSTTLTLLQNCHNVNLLLFTSLQFSEPAQLAALKHSVLFSVGHCRYIFLSECVLL